MLEEAGHLRTVTLHLRVRKLPLVFQIKPGLTLYGNRGKLMGYFSVVKGKRRRGDDDSDSDNTFSHDEEYTEKD